MSVLIAIPARRKSSRLPDKVLLAETGIPLIAHTIQQAIKAQNKIRNTGWECEVLVATDSAGVADIANRSGAINWVDNQRQFRCGTDRIAQALQDVQFFREDIIINLQADEPEIDPDAIHGLAVTAETMQTICTTVVPLEEGDEGDSNAVKASRDKASGFCIFSREMPHQSPEQEIKRQTYRHVGVYAFPYRLLIAAAGAKTATGNEDLEQNNWIAAGLRVYGAVRPDNPISVNTADDYRRFVKRWRETKDMGTRG